MARARRLGRRRDRPRALPREGADHGIAEERRLAYVAVTRARTDLLLTAHVWGSASTPRVTSRFLEEVRGAGLALAPGPWVDLPPVDGPAPENPRTADVAGVPWPRGRAARVGASGSRPRRRPCAPRRPRQPPDEAAAGSRWDDEVAPAARRARRPAPRRRRRRSSCRRTCRPPRSSPSPRTPRRSRAGCAARCRTPPALAARRGTAFHAWVEEHYARAAIVDVDALPGSADEDPDEADLATLREAFLASEWAGRTPVEVETSVETVLDGIAVRGRDRRGVRGARRRTARPGWVVVDWKTGAPATGARARARALQLAAYRLAWARLRGVDPGAGARGVLPRRDRRDPVAGPARTRRRSAESSVWPADVVGACGVVVLGIEPAGPFAALDLGQLRRRRPRRRRGPAAAPGGCAPPPGRGRCGGSRRRRSPRRRAPRRRAAAAGSRAPRPRRCPCGPGRP